MRMLVTGAAGSGTTTLPAALAEHRSVPAIEADEAFWLPTDPRYRLRAREEARFGQVSPAFLQWAEQYDYGQPEGRSLAKHDAWLSLLSCPVIRQVSELSVPEQIARATQVETEPARSTIECQFRR
jgi:hypothetical protein